jgi:hypothetical protein
MDAHVLMSCLQQEGHAVMSPRTVAIRGAEDVSHRQYAAAQQCAVLTANVRDFLTLHQTWQEDGRDHAGILALYRENNPRRDMTYAQDFHSRTRSTICICGASPHVANDSEKLKDDSAVA